MNDPGKGETQHTAQRSSRFWLLATVMVVFVLILGAGGYSWYSLTRSCEIGAVNQASSRLLQQLDSFDHSYQFAVTASRRAIVRPVEELQQIFMDTQQVRVPTCLQTARGELLAYMGTVIRAFMAYGAEESDTTVRTLIDVSDTHYDKFRVELRAVNECAPFCIP